jgi:thiamine pyrophosphate-dependent acetolactate synthase large subunit-like protein
MTAVREKLRLTVIQRCVAELDRDHAAAPRVSARRSGAGHHELASLAESFEAAGFAASCEEELGRALDAATATDRVSLIDARSDRSNYAATLSAVRG